MLRLRWLPGQCLLCPLLEQSSCACRQLRRGWQLATSGLLQKEVQAARSLVRSISSANLQTHTMHQILLCIDIRLKWLLIVSDSAERRV